MTKAIMTIWRNRAGAMLIAAVAVFALAQIVISVHAAKYGDGPHEHNGKACVLSLAAPGGDKAVINAAAAFIVAVAVWRIGDAVAQTERARLVVRAARPRGPPSL